MEEVKQAIVVGGTGHCFKVGQIVTLVKEVTDEYYGKDDGIEERYFLFVDENGEEQELQDDEDFVWVK